MHGNVKYPVPDGFVEEFNSIPNCTIKYFENKYGVSTPTVKRWAKITGVKFKKSNASLEEIHGKDNMIKWISQCKNSNDANTLIKRLNANKRSLVSCCNRLGLEYAHLMGKSLVKSPPADELRKLINEGVTNQEIETIYNCTNPVLKRWLKEAGIERIPYEGTIHSIPDDFIDWYLEYQPTKREISERYNVSFPTSTRWIKVCNLKYKGITTKIPIPPREELEDLNNQKLCTKEIAARYGIGQVLARQWLYHYDIKIQYDNVGKSKMELEIISFLNENGGNFISRKSVLENPYYELDGYDESIKMAIEFCGLYWHSYEVSPQTKKKHYEKYSMASDRGIKLYTIFENEWVNSPELVKAMLLSRMGIHTNRVYARKTLVRKISSTTARVFHEVNHISGGVNRLTFNIGLYKDDELISVMSFGRARFTKEAEWEIIRFSSKMGYQVVGGASKLFSYFIKVINPSNIISYADLRWGDGNVYRKLGFNEVGVTPANYFYFKRGEYELHSRIKFQKHKLSKILNVFDPELTEYENMINNGFSKIYDCGNAKFIWKK